MALSTAQSNQITSDFLGELKRVSWPTRAKTVQLTAIVVIISLIIGIYIGIIDTLLASGLKILTSLR
jgi:preprotein translocase SecE subunit